MVWSLGLLASAQGSEVLAATAGIADLPQSQAFVRGMGVATFAIPGKGRQGVGVDG